MRNTKHSTYALRDFFLAWMGETIQDPNSPEGRAVWVNSVQKMAASHPLIDVMDVYKQLQTLVEKLKASGDGAKRVDEILTDVGAWWAIGDRTANAYISHYSDVCEILKSAAEKRADYPNWKGEKF